MSSPQDDPPRGLIYVELLGPLACYKNGDPFPLQAGGVGPPQHRQMLGLLISRRGSLVPYDHLIEIARMTPRSQGHKLPNDTSHLPRAISLLLRRLGMGAALEQRGRGYILHRRLELWRTDTDDIEALYKRAQAARAAGDTRRAVAYLRQAEALSSDRYLPEFEACIELDLTVDAQARRWEGFQREVRHALARLCLALPDYDLHLLALEALERCCHVTPDHQSFLLAAAGADRLGNRPLAAFYRQRAADADDYF